MSVDHLIIRNDELPYCGRSVANRGIVVDRRPDHCYPSDGVTCKWCLKRLGVYSVPAGQVTRAAFDKMEARAIAAESRLATLTALLKEARAHLRDYSSGLRGEGLHVAANNVDASIGEIESAIKVHP